MGQGEEALKCFYKCLELNPNYDFAFLNMGIVYDKMGQINEALKYYDKAFELNPNFAEAFLNKGITFYNCGKYDEALALAYFTKNEEFAKELFDTMKKQASRMLLQFHCENQ